ncbi:MAG TPA: HlyD family secretion protein [Sphingomonas sp.]|uniref:HlyD family secretion protein n=1 Tax=Sphingomonas sp. TaxID=28214 RepID=UPI002D09E762|nr:HlyD family secretion protein [Sphingomonas sp.]HMI20954.1 HlyD family secretion protein [Sphingomonas sp.]
MADADSSAPRKIVDGEPVLDDELGAPVEPAPQSGRLTLRRILFVIGPVAALLIALGLYLHGGRYESTDNAYVQSEKVGITANISGTVTAVLVHDNQHVRAGDILFRIDPAPFEAAVAEAEAKLTTARSDIRTQRANYGSGASEVKAAQDRLHFAQREAARQKELLAEGISSQAQYDNAALAAVSAAQQIQTVQQQNEGVAASLGDSLTGSLDANGTVRAAQAALERARLNLQWTVVRAPQDGIVTKVDQLPVGAYVAASRPVFTLVGERLWIEANFKENQLNYMRLGQTATVKVDAFPGLKLTGHVVSFSPGTGNSFALLPAENATGNWVKVVQRLPVEIDLDRVPADVPLHAGLSAEVVVDTRHVRTLFGSDKRAPGAQAGSQ